MKTIKKITVTSVYVKYIPNVLEQDKIYISKEFGTIVHLCLRGCGEKSVTPIIPKFDGWHLLDENNKISITPSILNTNCPNKYHYVITNNIANVI